MHGAFIEIDETTGRAFSIEGCGLYQPADQPRPQISNGPLRAAFFQPRARQQTTANVLLPQTPPHGPFPFFHLLHGLSDDHRVGAADEFERYAEGLPLIVVMPNGGRGFYTDAEQGFAYETALVRELIPFIDRMSNTRTDRGRRCIGGLSMGGYGAVRELALKYPNLFVRRTAIPAR